MKTSSKEAGKGRKPFFPFGRKRKEKVKKPFWKEWLDAIIFAGIAAIIIRTFLLEAFMIPTSSMERSLRVGDFLFVSKFHYGARLPMTPLAIPFVHNKLPFVDVKSYLPWVRLPYMRIPGFVGIERNDIVVFNWPAHDIQALRGSGIGTVEIPSLKENYIKRCVAIPGDALEIREGNLYINGKPEEQPEEMQLRYTLYIRNVNISSALQELGMRPPVMNEYDSQTNPNANVYYMGRGPGNNQVRYLINMPPRMEAELKRVLPVDSLVRIVEPLDSIALANPNTALFPNDPRYAQTLDNLGPIRVPKKGETVQLNPENLPLYKRIIQDYERHKLHVASGNIYIDDEVRTSYTFEMDYYWMMGDNRYNSEDSRYWGFVPDDHVVGKPLLVFFSREGGIRWDRFLKLPN